MSNAQKEAPASKPAAKESPTPQERQAVCNEAINSALEQHDCRLIPQPVTEPMGANGEGLAVRVVLQVVPREFTK